MSAPRVGRMAAPAEIIRGRKIASWVRALAGPERHSGGFRSAACPTAQEKRSIIVGKIGLPCYVEMVRRKFAPGWPTSPSGLLFFRMKGGDEPCAGRSQKSSFWRVGRLCHCRLLLICNGPPERAMRGAQPKNGGRCSPARMLPGRPIAPRKERTT